MTPLRCWNTVEGLLNLAAKIAMRNTKFPSQQLSKIVATGLTLAATITAFCSPSLPDAQAQIPSGQYEVQPNGQIFFKPSGGGNPVVVYNGSGRAVAIIIYNGAVYTAFPGYIYRSADGQDLGGGPRTERVYKGSGTVNVMMVCQNAIFTAFRGGYIYRSPDGRNLGGGGNTSSVYRGSGQVNRMQCVNGNVVTSFVGGSVYQSPDGNNLGGGGRTFKLSP